MKTVQMIITFILLFLAWEVNEEFPPEIAMWISLAFVFIAILSVIDLILQQWFEGDK